MAAWKQQHASLAPTYRVDRDEALRYLGYAGQNLQDGLRARIEDAIGHCERTSSPKWTYRIFDLQSTPKGVGLAGSSLVLPGRDIAAHLCGAVKCAVMAATCGLSNERELQRLAAEGGLQGVVFDAAGSALAESVGDACTAAIVEEAHGMGLYANGRFGPGYGDLPLSVQPAIVRVLDADKRLGISVTEGNLLVPSKTITAFVGLFETPQVTARTCDTCSFAEHCNLRRKGTPCNR